MLFNDNCLNILPTIESESVDFVLADYPFASRHKQEYTDFVQTTADEFYRVLKRGGNLVAINNPANFFYTTKCYSQFLPRNGITLLRKGSFGCPYHFRFNHNYAWCLFKGNKKDSKTKWNGTLSGTDKEAIKDVILYENGYRIKGQIAHPEALSESLVTMFVELFTNEGDTVLDPFLGSGTTGVICERLGRNFIGIELQEKYYNMSVERIANEVSLKES